MVSASEARASERLVSRIIVTSPNPACDAKQDV